MDAARIYHSESFHRLRMAQRYVYVSLFANAVPVPTLWGTSYQLLITYHLLGQLIGMHRTNISEAMTQLQRLGFLKYTHHRKGETEIEIFYPPLDIPDPVPHSAEFK